MILLCVLSSLLFSPSLSTPSIPPNEEIHHITFLSNKIFYSTASRHLFGFLSRDSGEIMTQQRLKENQSIIRIDEEYNKIILRKSKKEALIFRLDSLHIQPVFIEIKFQHQQLVDLAETTLKVYAMTNKDLRVYDIDQNPMPENHNSVVSSCKKGQWFLRLYPQENAQQTIITILLLKDDELCIRKIKLSTRNTEQSCLFRLNSEIVSTHRISEGMFIESKLINYVIRDNFEFYSFKGEVSQIGDTFATLPSQFKTFDFKEQIAIEGIAVKGSTSAHQFLIKEGENNSYDLMLNGESFGAFSSEGRLARSWAHQKDEDTFALLVQFKQNVFQMFELCLSVRKMVKIWPQLEQEDPSSEQL